MQRKTFMKQALAATAGLTAFSNLVQAAGQPAIAPAAGLYVIGPTEGYSPHIGTIVSMLNYNRNTILQVTKGMTMEQLDHLIDPKANTIGSLIMHLGAVDKYYQMNSFEGRDDMTPAEKKIWESAMELGDKGRKEIRGHELKYYIDLITEVREKTLAEFKKRDDAWLLAVDPKFGDEKTPINTYWKWFHVCEHESNHRGQITWLKKRLPGAKDTGE